MTPFIKGRATITKNITVIDEWGKTYQPTWLRRAKGLVKNGRARWVDGQTIRLAYPPDLLSEEYKMEHINESYYGNDEPSKRVLSGNKEQDGLKNDLENDLKNDFKNDFNEVSSRYIYEQIKVIAADNNHIYDALRSLDVIDTKGVDGTGASKAGAIAHVVQAREATNQQMLRLLEKMYDDTRDEEGITNPKDQINAKMKHFQSVCTSLAEFGDHKGGTPVEVLEIIKEITKNIFG